MMMRTVFLLALVSLSQAFVVVPQRATVVKPLAMSDQVSDEQVLGETEKLLLAHKERKDSGIIQVYGKTVKNDGLDDLRAFIWGIFDVSNVVFPLLGAALSLGLFMNLAGFGYYFDHGSLVIDTLQNIQQEQTFQMEAAKLAASAAEKAGTMF